MAGYSIQTIDRQAQAESALISVNRANQTQAPPLVPVMWPSIMAAGGGGETGETGGSQSIFISL